MDIKMNLINPKQIYDLEPQVDALENSLSSLNGLPSTGGAITGELVVLGNLIVNDRIIMTENPSFYLNIEDSRLGVNTLSPNTSVHVNSEENNTSLYLTSPTGQSIILKSESLNRTGEIQFSGESVIVKTNGSIDLAVGTETIVTVNEETIRLNKDFGIGNSILREIKTTIAPNTDKDIDSFSIIDGMGAIYMLGVYNAGSSLSQKVVTTWGTGNGGLITSILTGKNVGYTASGVTFNARQVGSSGFLECSNATNRDFAIAGIRKWIAK